MNERKREKLFSVSIRDCRVDAIRNSKGAGGQHRDKTSSAIRVTHDPSGAVGFCQDFREQPRNKRTAFKRMAESSEFRAWVRLESARWAGKPTIESVVEEQMSSENIRVEVKESGRWVDE